MSNKQQVPKNSPKTQPLVKGKAMGFHPFIPKPSKGKPGDFPSQPSGSKNPEK